MTQQQTETWTRRAYGSGTQIVTSGQPDRPHLYVYGLVGDDISRTRICEDLVLLLNDDRRPAWWDDISRVSEVLLMACDGTSIFATGPYLDTDPPNGAWAERQDDEGKDARARLIDRLVAAAEAAKEKT